MNTFSVQSDGGGSGTAVPDADGLAAALGGTFNTLYRACIPSPYTVDLLTVRSLTSGLNREGSMNINAAGTLAAGSGTLPREVTMVLSLRTLMATRSGRGRMFFPSPLASSYLSAPDAWSTTTGYYTAVGAFGTALTATYTYAIGGDSFQVTPGVWSRTSGVFNPLVTTIRRTQPHWLRSRATAP